MPAQITTTMRGEPRTGVLLSRRVQLDGKISGAAQAKCSEAKKQMSRVRLLSCGRIRDVCIAVLFLAAGGASAQTPEPPMAPVLPLNPMAISRTGLYPQPYSPPSEGWVHSLSIEY